MRAGCLTAVALVLAVGRAVAGPTAWVSNERDNTLSVIDVDTLELIETVPVGQRPRGIAFSPDYTKLYICASDSDAVQVLDVATRTIVADLPSGADPEFFDLDPTGRNLYIANEDDAITTVVDTAERRVVAQIEVGVEPEGMAISHDGHWAVTTSETTNMVHWIDTRYRDYGPIVQDGPTLDSSMAVTNAKIEEQYGVEALIAQLLSLIHI